MASQTDVRVFEEGGDPKPKRRFDVRDFHDLSESIIDDFGVRKREREDRERHWKEIDRQVEMVPDITHKMAANGKLDPDKAWMSEMELPYQAQALEVLTADARRMYEAERWFSAHAEMTDDYLENVDFGSIILGDKAEVPSKLDQDNVDKLVEGFLLHQFRQYDIFGRLDRCNAEAFKYGMGVGRARMLTSNTYFDEVRGERTVRFKKGMRSPVLVPVSIKNLYLDTPKPSMHSATVLGPSHIAADWIRLENLKLAANKGSNDPDDPDGGWMPKQVRDLQPNDKGYVQVLELEGDLIVPRKTTRSMVIPGAIVTVAVGGKDAGGKVTHGVVRFRFRKEPWSSYLLFPYHYENADDHYPTSPLMKGRTVQIMAVQALNRLLDSAALKNAPPTGWDRTDTYFAAKGGPQIHPYAKWGTADPAALKVFSEIGGDPAAIAGVLTLAINMYAELTGVLPARLGAQTISHTTAFAKDAELQRGAVRTVDYVKQSGAGSLTRWLDMAYQMGRNSLSGRETISFFIDSYGGFVEIGKEHLPERAIFTWLGSGGPAEEAQKKQLMLQAAAQAIQLDQLDVQMGGQADVDHRRLKEAILRMGGWTDLDAIMRTDTATTQQPANPAAQVLALESLVPAS